MPEQCEECWQRAGHDLICSKFPMWAFRSPLDLETKARIGRTTVGTVIRAIRAGRRQMRAEYAELRGVRGVR